MGIVEAYGSLVRRFVEAGDASVALCGDWYAAGLLAQ